MAEDLWLVAGLGNPGARYQRTRHNIGFMIAEALALRGRSLSWKTSSRFAAQLAQGHLGPQAVLLLKPLTYMNLSGQSVEAAARFYEVDAQRLVVIHDDVDLDLGRIKVKAGGGDGGHKGIRSIAHHLGSGAFARIRVGIGRPQAGEVADFVLADFLPDEEALLQEVVGRSANAVETVLNRSVKDAMNQFNGARSPASRQEAPEKQ